MLPRNTSVQRRFGSWVDDDPGAAGERAWTECSFSSPEHWSLIAEGASQKINLLITNGIHIVVDGIRHAAQA